MTHTPTLLFLIVAAIIPPQALPSAQDKAPHAVAEIEACARVLECRNMRRSSLNWYDQVNIQVVEFSDDGQRYGLRSGPRGLSIWVTVKGDRSPSRLMTLGPDGKVVSAELFAIPPGSGGWPRRLTAEELAKWQRDIHALLPAMGSRGPLGEEFRPAWQEEADRALAAIRRQLAK